MPISAIQTPAEVGSKLHTKQCRYVLKEFFGGVPSYPKTAFNTIRLSLYQGRSLVMGGIPAPVKC